MNFPIPSPDGVQSALGLLETPEYVAAGGFKVVYKMKTDDGFEAIKAVHVPPKDEEDDDTMRAQLIARAEREIEALGHCASPSLVKLGSLLPQLLKIEGYDYLVYGEEFLTGTSLDSWLTIKKVPSYEELQTILKLLIDLIRTLSGAGFLHRDIKPANIMATGLEDRPYVVLDLGIAFKMHGTELTQGGSPPGTVRYMAPELLNPGYKDNMDFRCDLYAAGLTVYVLASGCHPFAQRPEHEYATIYRILNERPHPLSDLRPDLPPAFCAIIDRCIRKKPALRYAKIDLVEKALQEVTK